MSTQNVKVYKDLMGENEKWAAETRALLKEKNIMMINIIGSPGCGKTTLLESMVKELGQDFRFAVLEGDVEKAQETAVHGLGAIGEHIQTGLQKAERSWLDNLKIKATDV